MNQLKVAIVFLVVVLFSGYGHAIGNENRATKGSLLPPIEGTIPLPFNHVVLDHGDQWVSRRGELDCEGTMTGLNNLHDDFYYDCATTRLYIKLGLSHLEASGTYKVNGRTELAGDWYTINGTGTFLFNVSSFTSNVNALTIITEDGKVQCKPHTYTMYYPPIEVSKDNLDLFASYELTDELKTRWINDFHYYFRVAVGEHTHHFVTDYVNKFLINYTLPELLQVLGQTCDDSPMKA